MSGSSFPRCNETGAAHGQIPSWEWCVWVLFWKLDNFNQDLIISPVCDVLQPSDVLHMLIYYCCKLLALCRVQITDQKCFVAVACFLGYGCGSASRVGFPQAKWGMYVAMYASNATGTGWG